VSDITSKTVTLHWGLPESNGGSEITGMNNENVREDKIKMNTIDTLLSLVPYTVYSNTPNVITLLFVSLPLFINYNIINVTTNDV